jgi:hypothetical protein
VRSVVSALAGPFRGRAVLQLENLAFRHQLHVLGRQRPGRPGLFTIDRLLWVLAVLLMAALPGHYDVGQAGDGDSVAPARISALLATSRRGSAKSSGLRDESRDLWYGDEPPGRPLEAESLTLDPSAR